MVERWFYALSGYKVNFSARKCTIFIIFSLVMRSGMAGAPEYGRAYSDVTRGVGDVYINVCKTPTDWLKPRFCPSSDTDREISRIARIKIG